MRTFKDGDIFRWSYKKETEYCYWAASRIAIVKHGGSRLVDTFSSSENKQWDLTDQKTFESISVSFVANIDDLENIKEYNRHYYKDSDIIDLNHSNSTKGNMYIKKGTQKNLDKVIRLKKRERLMLIRELAHIKRSIEKADSDIVALNEIGMDFIDKISFRNETPYFDDSYEDIVPGENINGEPV